MNLLFNFFEDSNEEIMGREQKEEVLWWNVGKHRKMGRDMKNPVRLSVSLMCKMVLWRLLYWIYVDEHSGHARLDYWIWSQNCRNTILWHEWSTSQCTKWDAVAAGGNELNEYSNPLLGLAFDGITWWNDDLCTGIRNENVRILGPNLATC